LLSVLPRELVLTEETILELRGRLDCTRREIVQGIDDLEEKLKVGVSARESRVVVTKLRRGEFL
jgi:hypothetical protein